MCNNIYEKNYERLQPLLKDYLKIIIPGYMKLVVEKIGQDKQGNPEYSIAHYYEMNGDLVQDPEMTFRVYPELKTAEALSYYQPALGIYQEIYPEPGAVIYELKKELNEFLSLWLRNLELQGFIERAHNM